MRRLLDAFRKYLPAARILFRALPGALLVWIGFIFVRSNETGLLYSFAGLLVNLNVVRLNPFVVRNIITAIGLHDYIRTRLAVGLIAIALGVLFLLWDRPRYTLRTLYDIVRFTVFTRDRAKREDLLSAVVSQRLSVTYVDKRLPEVLDAGLLNFYLKGAIITAILIFALFSASATYARFCQATLASAVVKQYLTQGLLRLELGQTPPAARMQIENIKELRDLLSPLKGEQYMLDLTIRTIGCLGHNEAQPCKKGSSGMCLADSLSRISREVIHEVREGLTSKGDPARRYDEFYYVAFVSAAAYVGSSLANEEPSEGIRAWVADLLKEMEKGSQNKPSLYPFSLIHERLRALNLAQRVTWKSEWVKNPRVIADIDSAEIAFRTVSERSTGFEERLRDERNAAAVACLKIKVASVDFADANRSAALEDAQRSMRAELVGGIPEQRVSGIVGRYFATETRAEAFFWGNRFFHLSRAELFAYLDSYVGFLSPADLKAEGEGDRLLRRVCAATRLDAARKRLEALLDSEGERDLQVIREVLMAEEICALADADRCPGEGEVWHKIQAPAYMDGIFLNLAVPGANARHVRNAFVLAGIAYQY